MRTELEDWLIAGLDHSTHLAEVARPALIEAASDGEARDAVLALIDNALRERLVVAGDVDEYGFHPWSVGPDAALQRMRDEWVGGWGADVPAPGEIAWFDNTVIGDELARRALQRERVREGDRRVMRLDGSTELSAYVAGDVREAAQVARDTATSERSETAETALSLRQDIGRALRGKGPSRGPDGTPIVQPWAVGPGRIIALVAVGLALLLAYFVPPLSIALGVLGFILANTAWAHLASSDPRRPMTVWGQVLGGVGVVVGVIGTIALLGSR